MDCLRPSISQSISQSPNQSPKQVRQSGLPADFVRLPDTTLAALVDGYTREAGLRSLEREIAALCRAVAVELAKLPPGKEREAAPVITVSARAP